MNADRDPIRSLNSTINEKCKICGSRCSAFASAEVLAKHEVTYFRCQSCGLISTETPYWLDEAYSDPIARSDLGLASRNVHLTHKTTALINTFFPEAERFVDYGGGYGLFVRLMRDNGFNFLRYDTHCENIFAKGFDTALDCKGFDVLTAFEVFEHLANPESELSAMLSMAPTIIFTTELISRSNPPRPGEWWYYATHTGQHVTLYTKEALSELAKSKNLFFYSAHNFHVFSSRRISDTLFRLTSHSRVARLVAHFVRRRKSLLPLDWEALVGQKLE